MKSVLTSLINEPRVPDPPGIGWRDWVLVVGLWITAIGEAIFVEDVIWRPFVLVVALLLVPTLLWRRTHPLAGVALVFASFTLLTVASIVAGVGSVGLNTSAFVLILVYALFRWGSGRHGAIGLGFMLTALVVGFFHESSNLGDAIGGTIVLLLPAELGAVIRYRGSVRTQEIDQIKLQEREQLARELHDTVAHHISAIAIQAQAGRTLAATTPAAAVEALHLIEEEASRTLAEMRTMVGALRRGEEPDLAPQRGVADIERLADTTAGGPPVRVELSGDLADLGPSLDAALYRLAQESITNAARHARHATEVKVTVSGETDSVHLSVTDDGEAPGAATPGYGLIGMTERAELLGGTLNAGPNSGRGWTTHAVLPRSLKK